MERKRAAVVPSHVAPTIVCGGRRTGTTLLAAVLCSDERANPLGQEAQILTRIIEVYRWGREHFEQFGGSFFGDLKTYRAFFRDICGRFASEVSSRVCPGGVLVLKNPELSRILLDVAEVCPAANILATVRDPRDQVASELEVAARRAGVRAADLHFETQQILSLANAYVAYYYEILELRRQQPARINIVRYEDLVLHTDLVIGVLRRTTGLDVIFDATQPWSRVSPLAALHSSPSRSDLYGCPIDARSIGRYKRDLSTEDAAAVQEVCAHLMEEFGYQ